MTTAAQLRRPVGELLRRWRGRRRMSQFDLALESRISARHLSCVENGRSEPSRGTVLRLAEELDLPLRERNHLLLAAGYAPVYPEAALDSPGMCAVRAAVRQVLKGESITKSGGTWNAKRLAELARTRRVRFQLSVIDRAVRRQRPNRRTAEADAPEEG